MQSKNLLGKLKMFAAILVSAIIVLTGILLLIPLKSSAVATEADKPTMTIYTADENGAALDLLQVDNSSKDVDFWLNIKLEVPGDLQFTQAEVNLYYNTDSYFFDTEDEGAIIKSDLLEGISNVNVTSDGKIYVSAIYTESTRPTGSDILCKINLKLLQGKYPRKFEIDKLGEEVDPVEDTSFATFILNGTTPGDVFYCRDVDLARENQLNIGTGLYEQLTIILPDLKPVESISLDRTAYNLDVDGSVQLVHTIQPSDAFDKNVIWSTNDPEVASVVNGKVTAVGPGTATVKVKTNDGGYEASCVISVSSPVRVEKVELNKTSLSLVKDNSYTLTATVSPDDAVNKAISWSSSKTSVATVSDGVVTAVGAGTANITVTTADGGKTATCEVTVTVAPVAVTGVTLPATLEITVGSSSTLSATIEPAIATNQNVGWASDDTSVATVSASGVVTAKAVGTANITVTTEDGGKTATCALTVQPVAVTGVTLNKFNESVKVGNTLTISATVSPSNATNKTVTWASSDDNVATVENGVVKGIADGDIIITATAGGVSATCAVNVYTTPISVAGVSLPESASIVVGGCKTLTATLSPFNATNKTLYWNSSDTSVATVSGGSVYGRSAGTAEITVTTEDGGKTATCQVTVSTIDVTGVSLSRTEMTVVMGNSKSISATVAPYNATNKSVSWASDNTDVATVVDGVITAKTMGTANITVTTADGGKTATCVVTVVDSAISVSSVSLNRTNVSLNVGDTCTLTATVLPANATNKNISWASGNNSVATVSDGVVTAVGAGSTTITVTTEQGNLKATCSITVTTVAVSGITLDKTALTMVKQSSKSLVATVAPSNATNKAVVWESSDTDVATVVDGVITAKTAGDITITVKSAEDDSISATCSLKVVNEAVAVTGVTLSETSKTLDIGETFTLTATVAPSNATVKDVSWWSYNTSVATVSSSGLVTAVGAGTVNIAVITDDGSKMDSCEVTVKAPLVNLTKVTLNSSYVTIENGKTEALTSYLIPSNANNYNTGNAFVYEWESEDANVATVSNGVITAVNPGTTTVTLTVKAKVNEEVVSHTATCTVKVTQEFSKPALKMYFAKNANGTGRIDDLYELVGAADRTFYIIFETWLPEGVSNFTGLDIYLCYDTDVYSYKSGNDADAAYGNNIAKDDMTTISLYGSGCVFLSAVYKSTGFSYDAQGHDPLVARVQFELSSGKSPVPFELDKDTGISEITHFLADNSDNEQVCYSADPEVAADCYFSADDLYEAMYIELPEVKIPSEDTSLNFIKIGSTDAVWNETESRYEITVSSGTTSVEISAEATSPATIIAGAGTVSDLEVGENTRTITVKAEKGNTQNYTLVITRQTPVTGVSLDKSTLDLIKNDVATLTATVLPADAENKSVTWSSDTPAVATVANGMVTAVSAGTATITVTTVDGGFTATCTVTVANAVVHVESVTLDLGSKNLIIGDTFTLTATVLPANATNRTISWASDNTAVATVSNGVVTAVSAGVANITVTTADGAKTAVCEVTVSNIEVTGVTIDSTLTLLVGNSTTLTPVITPENATDKSVRWQSTNGLIVSVTDGVLTAVGVGEATVTVTTNDGGKTATCLVKVVREAVPVTGVTLDITSKDINVGDTLTLTATVAPENATDKTVIWSSGNTDVATVEDGVVTALSVGTVSITVTTAEGNKTAVCVVNVRTISVTGVTLDRSTLTILTGKTATLTATVAPDNAAEKGVNWTSSNQAVATVDANGVITAVGVGEATITATTVDGNLTATCTVTVVDEEKAVTGVTLDKSTFTIVRGNTATLTATVAPADATNKAVNWTSSDEAVATVDANGVVTAVSAGEATITVTTEDGGKTASCVVTVNPVAVTGVTLDKTDVTLVIDNNVVLVATVSPENADNQNVSWYSSDENIATVVNGVVTAVGEGTATITVTTESGHKTASCTVKVVTEAVAVESVSLDVTEKTDLVVGNTLTLTATVAPEDATNKVISWSSSDTSVATVANGVVTAVSAGTATITVTTQDGSKTATCNLTISNITVSSIVLDKTTLHVVKYDSGNIVATIAPENATNKNVIWTSSNDAVATVVNGVVTGVEVGEATITATTEDGGKIATCTVTVHEKAINVTGVTLDETSKTGLTVGDTFTLTATIAPEDATNTAVSWSSSDEAVATVEDGKVTIVGAGEATITVTTQDGEFTADCTVAVSVINVAKPTYIDSAFDSDKVAAHKFTYDGTAHTVISGTDAEGITVTGDDITQTDVKTTDGGIYTVTVTPDSGYAWNDNTVTPITFTFEVLKATDNDWTSNGSADFWAAGDAHKVVVPTAKYGRVTYTVTNDADASDTYTNKLPKTPGSYTFVAEMKEGSTNYNDIATTKTLTFTIYEKVAKPDYDTENLTWKDEENHKYSYDGEEHVFITNIDSEKVDVYYTLTGDSITQRVVRATAYTVTVTLKFGHIWSDYTDDALTFTFEIVKADLIISMPSQGIGEGDYENALDYTAISVEGLADCDDLETLLPDLEVSCVRDPKTLHENDSEPFVVSGWNVTLDNYVVSLGTVGSVYIYSDDHRLIIESTSNLKFSTYNSSTKHLEDLDDEKVFKGVNVGETVYLTGFNRSVVGVGEKLTLNILRAQFTTTNIAVYTADGILITNSSYVLGTNCRVRLLNGDGSVYQEAVIVIYGDITGDGYININDATSMLQIIARIKTAPAVYEILAADLDGNGNVTVVDTNAMADHISGDYPLWDEI